SPDPGTRRRALWMLAYLPDGLRDADRDSVLEVVLDTADYEDWWRASGWVRRMCQRFADDRFAARIADLALSNHEEAQRRGLRLLPHVLRTPLDADQRHLLE